MTIKRNIGQEILEGIREIKAGKGRKYKVEVPQDVVSIRQKLHLSQDAFASLMGISSRTLQEWEQGRRKPTGAACSLLRIAKNHPEAFMDVNLK